MIVVPNGPLLGAMLRLAVVTVKPADAASKLPSEPVPVTVYEPADPVIVSGQLNVPIPRPLPVTVQVAPVTVRPDGEEVNATVIGPPVSVVGVKPLPLIVADVPLGPELGEIEIAGAVTLNVPVLESPPGIPEAVIV